MKLVSFTVDGEPVQVACHDADTLCTALRRLQKFGVREACGVGMCGSCTVSLDGRTVSSCLVFAGAVDGGTIETVDSLSDDSTLHPIQQAFVDHSAFQCSFCTPGFLLATRELLAENPTPTGSQVRHHLSGNLCRCGSYLKIEEAVIDAAERLGS